MWKVNEVACLLKCLFIFLSSLFNICSVVSTAHSLYKISAKYIKNWFWSNSDSQSFTATSFVYSSELHSCAFPELPEDWSSVVKARSQEDNLIFPNYCLLLFSLLPHRSRSGSRNNKSTSEILGAMANWRPSVAVGGKVVKCLPPKWSGVRISDFPVTLGIDGN